MKVWQNQTCCRYHHRPIALSYKEELSDRYCFGTPISSFIKFCDHRFLKILATKQTKMEGDEEVVVTAPWYIWVGLTIIAAMSFWCQAVVTEER